MPHRHALPILLFIASTARSPSASRATELYIPFGRSPGLSGHVTFVGAVTRVNTASSTLTVAGPSGTRMLRVDERSWVYLDSSWVQRPNDYGAIGDIGKGDTVEIMFEKTGPHKRQGWADMRTAEWIKVKRSDR